MTVLLGDNRLNENFWAKVEVFPETGCWEWTGSTSPKGYGQLTLNGRAWQAHRLAFTKLVRPIPVGLVVDHLCENRCCVNPNHFDIVTIQHNNFVGWGESAMQIRFPYCKEGHPFDASNSGGRFCTQCRNHRNKLQQRKRRSDPEKAQRMRELGRGYDAKRRQKVAA